MRATIGESSMALSLFFHSWGSFALSPSPNPAISLLGNSTSAQAISNLPTNASSDPSLLSPSPVGRPVGLSCYYPGGTHHNPTYLDNCLTAVQKTLSEQPRNLLLPQTWRSAGVHIEGVTVPASWKDGGCSMVVNTDKAGAASFALIAVVYFAALIIQECVLGEKVPLGGRFVILEDSFYVEITGDKPGEQQGMQGNITGTSYITDSPSTS